MTLARLRPGLDYLSVALAGTSRDCDSRSFHYSDAILVVPPVWVLALIVWTAANRGGYPGVADEAHRTDRAQRCIQHFVQTLQSNGFLESPEFFELREQRHAEFAMRRCAGPSTRGKRIRRNADGVRETMQRYFVGGEIQALA